MPPLPAIPEVVDALDTTRSVAKLPMISSEQYQYVGRYSGAVVMHVFEMMGGAGRMANWADSNPTDFYTKIFPKMISRSQQVDVNATITVDDAINRLEAEAGDFHEVNSPADDAEFDDFEEPLEYDI